MQIKVTDLFKMHGVTRGYCICGREVQRGKDKECPVCRAELIWNVPCEIGMERECDPGCKHYSTCIHKW